MRTYYRSLAFLFCFCLLLASTCKKEDLAGHKNIPLNTPFEIAINEKAIIQGSNAVMEIVEISENRCPTDVQCFSAGDVKVKLNISGVARKNAILSFCIGQCDNRYRKADTLSIVHQNQAYTIKLSEVNPYPGTGGEKKTAVFTINTD